MTIKQYNAIIIGGGIVGLSLASLLVKNNFSVALVESVLTKSDSSTSPARVSAINLASQALLDYAGAWTHIDKHSYTPLVEMHIGDHTQKTHLHFNSHSLPDNKMGFIVENNAIIAGLEKTVVQVDFFRPNYPKKYCYNDHKIQITLDNNIELQADLLIGADGANSWVRDQMPIELKTRSYQQKSIIAVIESEVSHNNAAYQQFLTTGPVALLPQFNTRHTSLVWSADNPVSDALMQKSDQDFSAALTDIFNFKLGNLKVISKRLQFPLTMRHATEYAVNQLVLVGDAAHTIHPLAGLGVNLGLMDAACLTQVFVDARNEKKLLSDQRALRRYTRWRKAENTGIIQTMRLLKELFAIDTPLTNTARSATVNTIDRCNFIKAHLMGIATGSTLELPLFLKNTRSFL